MNEVLFSRKSDEWATPAWLFGILNSVFHFDFDPCPLRAGEFVDALTLPKWGERNFVNPPYSDIKGFVIKAAEEFLKGRESVFLIPARTDTKIFHEVIYKKFPIVFLKGRLQFGESKNSAPFPSMLVFFLKKENENLIEKAERKIIFYQACGLSFTGTTND